MGVIYLVVLNLPRNVRYKRENVILIGIIPGPCEPPLTINSYLTPLVLDLLELWHGVQMEVSGSASQLVRAALIAVSCDLPAGRKVCGFLSHSANLGCSRCMVFPTLEISYIISNFQYGISEFYQFHEGFQTAWKFLG